MALEFQLPEIGEGVVEGEIVSWHVAKGDTVRQDQVVVSVLTDKANVEIPSSFNGVVTATFGAIGDLVPVGATLLTYSEAGAKGASAAAAEVAHAPATNAHATAPKPESVGEVISFLLPEIGEGVLEGEIVEWHVQVGDQIGHDKTLVSILTDKATVEIPSPIDGEIVETHGRPGEVLTVGHEIAKIRSKVAAAKASPAAQAAAPAASAPAAAPKPAPAAKAVNPADNPSISAFGTPLATPAVRRLAAQKGLDLSTVVGSGPNHRILMEDLEHANQAAPASAAPAAQSASPSQPVFAPAAVAPSAGETREKLKGLRKAIYTSMIRSKSTIPHFTYVDEVEMDKLVAIRSALLDSANAEGVKLTYLPFIVKAIVTALRKFPILNASVDDAAGEIVYKAAYNMGIATATPHGLTVPVLKAADTKNILTISREIAELSERARNRRSTQEDLSGGTFTITSLGRLGGLLATPIINHPEVGILGIHNLQERAVVRDGQITIRKMMNISLSFDHRVVDGDVGASFAQEVKSYLEEPSKLMLSMV